MPAKYSVDARANPTKSMRICSSICNLQHFWLAICPTTAAAARGSNLRVHFKNTRETACNIKGMPLRKAQKFLQDVIEKKQAVAFRRYTGGVGRHAQAKAHKKVAGAQCRWPKKSCEFLLSLLKNAESNAEARLHYWFVYHTPQ